MGPGVQNEKTGGGDCFEDLQRFGQVMLLFSLFLLTEHHLAFPPPGFLTSILELQWYFSSVIQQRPHLSLAEHPSRAPGRSKTKEMTEILLKLVLFEPLLPVLSNSYITF